jgi:hypothetical protein
MKYSRKLGVVFSAIIFLLGIMLFSASPAQAQTRRTVTTRVYRPVIVRHYVRDPFWYSRWGFYDPFYDPYFYDPYLRERRERYYKEKAVRDANRKWKKDREKYASDGILTAKERRKLAERQEKYHKAVRKLAKFNAES